MKNSMLMIVVGSKPFGGWRSHQSNRFDNKKALWEECFYNKTVSLFVGYFPRCSYLENLDKHWYSISSKLVWKTQIHVRYNITIFKNLIIKVLEMIRNFRKPLTLYKCMKKRYISQVFSIFSTRYKKWSIQQARR